MKGNIQVGVVGLGKFGLKFGQTLVELGRQVVGVDTDPEKIRQAQQVFTQVLQADATDKEALRQIGFGDLSHVLVSVGDSIAASTMISMFLKELRVPEVWVKAINKDHEKLLRKIGVDEVFIPEHLAANQLANRIAIPGFIEYLPFESGMVLKQLVVNEWSGKVLRDLDLTNRFSAQIVAIKKKGEAHFRFIPKGSDMLQQGDTLVVLGTNDLLARIVP